MPPLAIEQPAAAVVPLVAQAQKPNAVPLGAHGAQSEDAPAVTRSNVLPMRPRKQPVKPARKAKPKTPRAPSGTLPDEPFAVPGHEWRKSGAGWVLWRRVPAVSATGKRSSQRQFAGYYSATAVALLKAVKNEKTA